jgi:hypothetical protein
MVMILIMEIEFERCYRRITSVGFGLSDNGITSYRARYRHAHARGAQQTYTSLLQFLVTDYFQ